MEYSRVKKTMTNVSMASRVTVMKGAQLDSPPSDSIAWNSSIVEMTNVSVDRITIPSEKKATNCGGGGKRRVKHAF